MEKRELTQEERDASLKMLVTVRKTFAEFVEQLDLISELERFINRLPSLLQLHGIDNHNGLFTAKFDIEWKQVFEENDIAYDPKLTGKSVQQFKIDYIYANVIARFTSIVHQRVSESEELKSFKEEDPEMYDVFFGMVSSIMTIRVHPRAEQPRVTLSTIV